MVISGRPTPYPTLPYPTYVCLFLYVSLSIIRLVFQVAASSLNGEVDTATHMINSFHLIHTTLTVFEFVDDQLEMLQVRDWRFDHYVRLD